MKKVTCDFCKKKGEKSRQFPNMPVEGFKELRVSVTGSYANILIDACNACAEKLGLSSKSESLEDNLIAALQMIIEEAVDERLEQ